MKESKTDLIIIIIFIFFLIGPNILYWFIGDKMDKNNYENRGLSEKPVFSLKTIATFPTQYETYFNDHLAFKNEIRKFRSTVLYSVFKTTSNDRVIYGNNGWLFYDGIVSGDCDPIGDFRKLTKYSEFEKETIKNNLVDANDYLNDKNIDFYVFIIPNKENVYNDYLPKFMTVNKNNKVSRTENLIEYLRKNTNLNIIYPKQILIDGRNNENTYFKYDTHWNNYGAYLGVIDLMKSIDSSFNVPEILLGKELVSGDLANMNLMQSNLKNYEPIIQGFFDDIEANCNDEAENFKICSSNGIYDKTILFVGDSFRKATVQYLSKIYKNSVFIHRDIYNQDFVKKYDADIVVYEVVERYSEYLNDSLKITNYQ